LWVLDPILLDFGYCSVAVDGTRRHVGLTAIVVVGRMMRKTKDNVMCHIRELREASKSHGVQSWRNQHADLAAV
jgi:hypothetical protein